MAYFLWGFYSLKCSAMYPSHKRNVVDIVRSLIAVFG